MDAAESESEDVLISLSLSESSVTSESRGGIPSGAPAILDWAARARRRSLRDEERVERDAAGPDF